MLVRHPAGIVSSLARIGTGWSDNLPDIASQPELVRDYLAPYADELQRAAGEPLDPIAHGALLWRVIHAGIAHQVARNPRFVVVRYEDLASDPLNEFRALYDRLDGVTFNRSAEAAVRSGCLAGPAQRNVPWGRVGLGRSGVPADAEPGQRLGMARPPLRRPHRRDHRVDPRRRRALLHAERDRGPARRRARRERGRVGIAPGARRPPPLALSLTRS